jgi:hypothetical protein
MDRIIKTIIGSVSVISGIILYGFVLLAYVVNSLNVHGWSNPPGRFFTVLTDCSAVLPFLLSIISVIMGGTILFFQYTAISRK